MKALMTPFAVRNGTLSVTEDYDDIVRCQVIDALVTNAGERLMYPDWGCNIAAMLFNPDGALERADTETYVKNRLTQMVPRAFIQSVEIAADPSERGIVYIKVRYKSAPYSPERDVTVPVTETEEIISG